MIFKKNVSDDEWKIVKARVQRMPPHLKLHIGGLGSFSKEQLVDEINKKSDVGKLLVKINLNYLRSFKEESKLLKIY